MAQVRHPVLWVVIADGEHARIVVPTRVARSFTTLEAFDSAKAHMKSHELGTDHPGRSFESASSTRHAVEPKHDLHREAKHAFIVQVARHLDAPAAAGTFDRLVLVAPDRALHDLREALGRDAAERVAGTLDKDLTKVPDDALDEHVGAWWVAPPPARA